MISSIKDSIIGRIWLKRLDLGKCGKTVCSVDVCVYSTPVCF